MGGNIRRKREWLDAQARMHLGLLERALFVEGIEENERRCYVLTPKGEAYLENVELR